MRRAPVGARLRPIQPEKIELAYLIASSAAGIAAYMKLDGDLWGIGAVGGTHTLCLAGEWMHVGCMRW